jgi:hypothetical protein
VEPDLLRHHIFDTYAEAMTAWVLLSDETREVIQPPRQSHDCWIFDKIEQG